MRQCFWKRDMTIGSRVACHSLSSTNEIQSGLCDTAQGDDVLPQVEGNETAVFEKSYIKLEYFSLPTIDQCNSEEEGCSYATEGEIWTWQCFEFKIMYCCLYYLFQ